MEEYKCKKGVIMEISGIVAFTTGQVYKRIKPEIWPPDRSIKHCLEDNQANEHFFSPREFNEHFERVGVVENFAHEPTKEPLTEALNKHNVGGRSEQFYCADWNRCGAICEEQCPACSKTNLLTEAQ